MTFPIPALETMTKCNCYLLRQTKPAAEHAGSFTMDRHRRSHALFRIGNVSVGSAIGNLAHDVWADRRGQANFIAGYPSHLGGVCSAAHVSQQRDVEHLGDPLIPELQIVGEPHRKDTGLNGVTTRLTHAQVRRQGECGKELSQPNLSLHPTQDRTSGEPLQAWQTGLFVPVSFRPFLGGVEAPAGLGQSIHRILLPRLSLGQMPLSGDLVPTRFHPLGVE
jgi:hypothetical protein